MCAGVILQSRIGKVVYGAKDFKWGACESKLNLFKEGLFNHNVKFEYQENKKCEQILKNFFKSKRS